MIPFVILAMEDDDDRAFMTEVYLQYERLMWSEIRGVLNGQCDPEEVFQTALVKLVANVKKLRSLESRPMVNYIITAVKNTAIDALRRLNKGFTDSIDDEEWIGRLGLCSDDDLDDTISRREAVGKLRSIWHLLDDRSRYLLEGKYFLDLSTHEMGAVLGITHDSVRVELSRARRRAKKLLEEHCRMTGLND